QQDGGPPPVVWWARLLRILVALAFVGAGVAGAAYLKNSAPKPKKRPPVKWVPLVSVQPLDPQSHQVVVAGMGVVIPAHQVVLKARVSGQVAWVNPEFIEGGVIAAGDEILRLEDTDYQLALAQRKSEWVDSKYALELEQGRQEVAQREWQLLNREWTGIEADDSLALRKPHLEKVKAGMAAAETAVEKAALDLKRTVVKAPFNAMVRSRSVDLGSQVTAQEPLADLVGTDTYWVRAALPIDRLDWIDIPQDAEGQGATVKVVYRAGRRIEGRVVRLLGDLASEGRMAQILIAVSDPLGRGTPRSQTPPLLIGEYVRVEITGERLEAVYPVPRTALRDDDTIWLAGPDDTLEVRKVLPVWRGSDTVLLRDHLQPGDRLIVSDLAAPVPGMELRVQGEADPGSGAERQPSMEPDKHRAERDE
ncbi:MAG: efflux RND transporter periplasmic adaptor subunit, partial [Anaerolineae bacterium]